MIYRFERFEVDDEAFRLTADGVPVPLEPKPLRLLLYLMQNRNRLVKKQELLDSLWSDTFVMENTLTRSVGMLRKALGENAREPKFIENVPTLGYRFIGDVSAVDGPVAVDSPAASASVPLDHSSAPAESAAPAEIVDPRGDPRPKSKAAVLRLWWLLLAVSLGAAVLGGVWGVWMRRRPVPPDGPIRSLAVLPLEDLSPGTREDYFADGMTDELITELARIPDLRVVSRASAMQNKGLRKPLALIAQDLHVDAIVEGSVVRSGDRVRITAQLVDARTDRHLWAQSFEGRLVDILSLQDDVAREITLQTSAVLTPSVKAGLTNAKHVDPAAHDAYLRGLYFIQRREGALAVSYFRKAIALQPGYGAANAGLAEALTTQMLVSGMRGAEVIPDAIAAARRAIELEPESGEAYTAMGAIEATYLWDWKAAEQNLRKGIELSPSSSDAQTWFAVYLTTVGRPGEAVEAMRRAVSLNPLSFWANRLLGSMLYYNRQYDESLQALQRASELAPDKAAFVENWRSVIYEMKGQYGNAVASELTYTEPPQDAAALRTAFETGGWRGYQEAEVRYLLPRSARDCAMSPAMSYLRLGNYTEAFRWLNHEVDNHCDILDLASDPRLDPLREDERFRALLRRVHLPLP